MANNRMYMECTVCDAPDLFYIGKRLLDGYYIFEDEKYRNEFANTLNTWFEKHNHYDARTQDHFRIVYECQRNYDIGTGLEAVVRGKIEHKPEPQE